jgi:hypothetical protein
MLTRPVVEPAACNQMRGKLLLVQGGVKNGILRWSLEIVRQCDMFWMGVTSNSGLDMSTMIARNPQVWMISEEGTCIEHCRGPHVLAPLLHVHA